MNDEVRNNRACQLSLSKGKLLLHFFQGAGRSACSTRRRSSVIIVLFVRGEGFIGTPQHHYSTLHRRGTVNFFPRSWKHILCTSGLPRWKRKATLRIGPNTSCSSTLRVEHSGLYPTPLSSPFFRRSCRVLKTPSSF